MKNRTLKVVAIVAVIAMLLACAAVFAGCNKDKTKSIEDLFVNRASGKEFTTAESLFTLPANWSVYVPTSTSGETTSDTGYLKELDAFVVKANTEALTIIKCHDDRTYFEGGEKGQIFPLYTDIRALRVAKGYIVCRFGDGKVGAFDYNGVTVLSRGKSKASFGTSIDNIIKILDGGMFALADKYDMNGEQGYTSIYRATTDGNVDERGKLACRVQNEDGDVKYVDGFDGKYASVVGNSEGSYMFRVPDSGNSNLDSNSNSRVSNVDNKSRYSSEITYIGGGKFYIHEDWTVSSTDDYMFSDGTNYYCYKRSIYRPDNNSRSDYNGNGDKIFAYMTNGYYSDQKAGIDVKEYLKAGYTYVSCGITIKNKIPSYDQFIVDGDMNIVMSLSDKFGVNISGQKKDKASNFDLILTGVDGNYFSPVAPSVINIYDKNGTSVGHNGRSNAQTLEVNNGAMVIKAPSTETSSSSPLYGAYNMKGQEIVPFKYLSLDLFVGNYAVGERRNDSNVRTRYIVGIDGNEVTAMADGSKPLADIAQSPTGIYMYEAGCYMFKQEIDNPDGNGKVTRLGVKSLNPNLQNNILMEATMETGSLLYSPDSDKTKVFVFARAIVDGQAVFTVWQMV